MKLSKDQIKAIAIKWGQCITNAVEKYDRFYASHRSLAVYPAIGVVAFGSMTLLLLSDALVYRPIIGEWHVIPRELAATAVTAAATLLFFLWARWHWRKGSTPL